MRCPIHATRYHLFIIISKLQSFSSKWTFPEEKEGFSACVSVSVLDTTEVQIESVLSGLSRDHLLELKSFREHLALGIQSHASYEQKCAKSNPFKNPPRPTLYWKIEVESEPLQTLWKTLQADSKYQLQFSFHITLAFLGAESSMHWTVLLQDSYIEVDMGK